MHGTLAYVDGFGGSPTRAELRCYIYVPYIMLFVCLGPAAFRIRVFIFSISEKDAHEGGR